MEKNNLIFWNRKLVKEYANKKSVFLSCLLSGIISIVVGLIIVEYLIDALPLFIVVTAFGYLVYYEIAVYYDVSFRAKGSKVGMMLFTAFAIMFAATPIFLLVSFLFYWLILWFLVALGIFKEWRVTPYFYPDLYVYTYSTLYALAYIFPAFIISGLKKMQKMRFSEHDAKIIEREIEFAKDKQRKV